jgi:glyoxylase-like metal-dependent hydrolase (beta-lactamase superfamily II)
LWLALFGEDEVRKIRENLWVLISVLNNPTMTVFRRGTTFTVTDPGVGLLWHCRRRALRRLMAEQGVTRVESVIPSHAHPDHIGALETLMQEFGPVMRVFVSVWDRWMLLEPQTLPARMERNMADANDHFRPWFLRPLYGIYGILSRLMYGSGVKPWRQYRFSGLTIATLVDPESDRYPDLVFDGYQVHLFRNPGHCPGELAMEVESLDGDQRTIVICGDIVVNDERGRNLYPSAYLPDGWLPDILVSLVALLSLKPDVLIVTHSQPLVGREYIHRRLTDSANTVMAVADFAAILTILHPEWTLEELAKQTFREFGMKNISTFGIYEKKTWVLPIFLGFR